MDEKAKLKNGMKAQWTHAVSYHEPPSEEKIRAHESVNQVILEAGHAIIDLCPESPALIVGLERLREARAWAHAAIACEKDEE